MRYLIICLALAGCGQSVSPGIEVRTVEVPVIEQRPCPADAPVRPPPLAKPLPTDAKRLSVVLAAKLLEYAGDGKYADRAEAYFKACGEG